MEQLNLDTTKDYTFTSLGGNWGLRYSHNLQEWKRYHANFKGHGTVWQMDRIDAALKKGIWYNMKPVEPAATCTEFELFDRVALEGNRYIVVTDKSGNKMLLGEHKGFAHVSDIDPDAAFSVYDRPAYPNDLFDFSEVGELKYESAKMKRRNVLTDRLIELQNELTEINEELSALN